MKHLLWCPAVIPNIFLVVESFRLLVRGQWSISVRGDSKVGTYLGVPSWLISNSNPDWRAARFKLARPQNLMNIICLSVTLSIPVAYFEILTFLCEILGIKIECYNFYFVEF
jgi:hypothetical protein